MNLKPMQRSNLLLSVMVAAGFLAWYFGLTNYIWIHDGHYLATALTGYIACAFLCSMLCPGILLRAAELSTSIGLLFTVVGFSVGLSHVEATGDTSGAISGAFTAYHTTALGLFGAILLTVHSWVRGDK